MNHLRTLRANLAEARNALMNYKDDRLDRDRLEPAARRVDDLINMFTSSTRSVQQGSAWVAEVQRGIEQVTNAKAAEALGAARIDIAALLEAMQSDAPPAPRSAT